MSASPEDHPIPWGIFAADLILPWLSLREWGAGTTWQGCTMTEAGRGALALGAVTWTKVVVMRL